MRELAALRETAAHLGIEVKSASDVKALKEMMGAQNNAAAPGLKGTMLLRLAHDRLAERAGIPQQMEHRRASEEQQRQQALEQERRQRQQELEAHIRQRDQEWQALLVQERAAWAARAKEADQQRQLAASEHTRMAKRAASVNVKSTPGHGRSNAKTIDDTLNEIAARHFADRVYN